jgi:phospholipid-translocating ATPase
MDVPELYRFGRERHWFNLKNFFIYMLDGIYQASHAAQLFTVDLTYVQSVIIYFFIMFAYRSPTSRTDGWDMYINEMSTTMALTSVMVANFYTGLMATAWTFWIFFALAFGLAVVWGFTVRARLSK